MTTKAGKTINDSSASVTAAFLSGVCVAAGTGNIWLGFAVLTGISSFRFMIEEGFNRVLEKMDDG